MKLAQLAKAIFVLAAGMLFAFGLVLGGMTQPSKVIGFLDITGDWDPALMFVMVGAIGAYLPLHKLVLRRERPLFAPGFSVPTRRDLDLRLITGAALFGVGWGLAGFCPGPGITSLAARTVEPLVFVLSMLVGMAGLHAVDALREQWAKRPPPEATTQA